MPDKEFPRISFFLCQQHRRDLVEVSEWMSHPNTAYGINGITIKTPVAQQEKLKIKLEAVFGRATSTDPGFSLRTPNGSINVITDSKITSALGPLPDAVMNDNQPSIVGMEFLVRDIDTLSDLVKVSGLPYKRTNSRLLLEDASLLGNTLIQFSQQKNPY